MQAQVQHLLVSYQTRSNTSSSHTKPGPNEHLLVSYQTMQAQSNTSSSHTKPCRPRSNTSSSHTKPGPTPPRLIPNQAQMNTYSSHTKPCRPSPTPPRLIPNQAQSNTSSSHTKPGPVQHLLVSYQARPSPTPTPDRCLPPFTVGLAVVYIMLSLLMMSMIGDTR